LWWIGPALAVVAEDALGTEGGAIHVSREVLQSRLAPADGLDIGHPIQGPDSVEDLDEEMGMVLLQSLLELWAQAHRQGGLGQEVGRVLGTNPAQAVGGEAAGGHDAMDVGMKAQVARPSLKHGQQTHFGTQIFVVAPDVSKAAALCRSKRS